MSFNMKRMTDILEGVLGNADDILSAGIADLVNPPSIKDFEKDPYYGKRWVLSWKEESILDRYRQLYPDMIEDKFKYLQITIDTELDFAQARLCICDKPQPLARRKVLPGWHSGYEKQYRSVKDVNIFKKIMIEVFDKFVKDPDTLDEVMVYAHEMSKKKGHTIGGGGIVKSRNLKEVLKMK